jgi:peptidoglycan/LPS O-acetylase OafA/YrhL
VQDRKWPALDGLRGIAVTAVVAYHLELAKSGFLGVDVFFVLSGFLITGLVAQEFGRTDNVNLPRFYLRRSLRLYPALVGVVLFCLGVAVVTRREVTATVHDGVAALLYVGNLVSLHGLLDHVWTLALEEQFYLLWPLLLALALRSSRRWRFVPAASLVGLLLVADLLTGQNGSLHTYVRAMGLPLGCVLALSSDRTFRRFSKMGPVALAGLLVALLLPLPAWLSTGWPLSIGALLAMPVVPWLVLRPPRALVHPLVRWFGLRSYSLYLWHFPLTSLVQHHAPAPLSHPLRVAVGAGVSLAAAELSYRLIEQPVLRLRDKPARPAAPQDTPAEPVDGAPGRPATGGRYAAPGDEVKPRLGVEPPR